LRSPRLEELGVVGTEARKAREATEARKAREAEDGTRSRPEHA
jgi:hypothetical protein